MAQVRCWATFCEELCARHWCHKPSIAGGHTAVPIGRMPDITIAYDYDPLQGVAVLYRSKKGQNDHFAGGIRHGFQTKAF